MAPYQLKLLADVEKQIRRLPRSEGERVVEAMRSLRSEPRHKAGDPGPQGAAHLEARLYRIRVGCYRILYAAFDEQVIVLVCAVARRTDATYRDLRALMSRARKALEGPRAHESPSPKRDVFPPPCSIHVPPRVAGIPSLHAGAYFWRNGEV